MIYTLPLKEKEKTILLKRKHKKRRNYNELPEIDMVIQRGTGSHVAWTETVNWSFLALALLSSLSYGRSSETNLLLLRFTRTYRQKRFNTEILSLSSTIFLSRTVHATG